MTNRQSNADQLQHDDKKLVERLRGHAEIMGRDKGKFVRFIDASDCIEAGEHLP